MTFHAGSSGMIFARSTRLRSSGLTQIGRRFGSVSIWHLLVPHGATIYQRFYGRARYLSVPGNKVTTERERVTLRLPRVLLNGVSAIVRAEGWANRQAFIEQAVREKVDRWHRDHSYEAAPRRS